MTIGSTNQSPQKKDLPCNKKRAIARHSAQSLKNILK
jgi:hypothetical protein